MKATFLQKGYGQFSEATECIPAILNSGKVLIMTNAFRAKMPEQQMKSIQRYIFLIRFHTGIEILNAISPKVRLFFYQTPEEF